MINQKGYYGLCIEFNTQKRIEAEKKVQKDGKSFYKLMNNAVYSKTMENLRNKVDIRLAINEKDYLKWTSKLNFVTQKKFDNNLVAIHKIKTTSTLKKKAYVEMCILELSKVPMYVSSIMIMSKTNIATNINYYSQILTDRCMILKLKMFLTILVKIKKCLILIIILLSQNFASNALVVGQMKHEMGGVVIEEFVVLKPKVLVSVFSEYKKAKVANKKFVAKISHNEYKDVLLNKVCLRHSMNRIKSKNLRIGTYEINKSSCFALMAKFIFLIMC